jgi:hypothetical protein
VASASTERFDMSTLLRAVYQGPFRRLQGKTALIRLAGEQEEPYWWAQFDSLGLPESIGWHGFDEFDFLVEGD